MYKIDKLAIVYYNLNKESIPYWYPLRNPRSLPTHGRKPGVA